MPSRFPSLFAIVHCMQHELQWDPWADWVEAPRGSGAWHSEWAVTGTMVKGLHALIQGSFLAGAGCQYACVELPQKHWQESTSQCQQISGSVSCPCSSGQALKQGWMEKPTLASSKQGYPFNDRWDQWHSKWRPEKIVVDMVGLWILWGCHGGQWWRCARWYVHTQIWWSNSNYMTYSNLHWVVPGTGTCESVDWRSGPTVWRTGESPPLPRLACGLVDCQGKCTGGWWSHPGRWAESICQMTGLYTMCPQTAIPTCVEKHTLLPHNSWKGTGRSVGCYGYYCDWACCVYIALYMFFCYIIYLTSDANFYLTSQGHDVPLQ